ncbi:unnamed protein product [Durusdinium trenchii]|uniref:Protein kinase domain-containing protein n=1 Tax=Durusdinium trenchii TaxID=1381693 RepID=A0ABP0SB47_9DINO
MESLRLIFTWSAVLAVAHEVSLSEDCHWNHCTPLAEVSGAFSLIQRSLERSRRVSPWIGKNGNPIRDGSTSALPPTKLSRGPTWTWTAPHDGLVRASPIIDAQGNIYLSIVDGVVYKFDRQGKELWRFNAGGSLFGNGVWADDVLYTVREDCTFIAIDPSNGKDLWRQRHGEGFGSDTPSVMVGNGVVVAACYGKGEKQKFGGATFLVGVNASNGSPVWTMKPEKSVYNFLASVVHDALLFADQNGGVYKLKMQDGSVVWHTSATSNSLFSTGGLTVGRNGLAYVTSNRQNASSFAHIGVLTALDVANGEVRWQQEMPLPANSAAAIGTKGSTDFVVVAIGPNPAAPGPLPGLVFDVDPVDGVYGNLLKAPKPGKAMAFKVNTGEPLWSFDFPQWEGMAAGDREGHVCLPDSFANPSIGGDGSTYVGSMDGRIYRLLDLDDDGDLDLASEVDSFDTKNAFQGAPALSLLARMHGAEGREKKVMAFWLLRRAMACMCSSPEHVDGEWLIPQAWKIRAVEQSWRAVYSLVVMILIAISPIGLKEGLRPFCTVVIYLACLSLVKMWVKETMNAGFQYPDSITAVHMFCTSLAACCFERPRLEEALLVLPISVVNGASLLTNNTALLYGGVAFVSMVSSCTPMFTFGLELFKKRRSLDFLTSFSVILVCSGSAFCVRGEKTASVLALVFASMAALLRAMKGVWQHDLLTISVSPMRLVYWSGFWSFWITISMVALNEGTEAVRHFPTAKPEAKSAFLLSVCAAVVLNITQCFAVKQLGALLQSIVGNLNLILVIALSQAWLREQVTFWQYVGVFLLAAGTFANKYGGLQKKNTEKEQLVEKKTDAQEQAGERTPEPEPSETSETSYGATDSTGCSEEVVHEWFMWLFRLSHLAPKVRICDFGWSAEVKAERALRTTCGTPHYWPPEIFEGESQDTPVDLWALGTLVYELLVGHAPFWGSVEEIRRKVLSVDLRYPPQLLSNEAIQLFYFLLRRDPHSRTPARQLLEESVWVRQGLEEFKARGRPSHPARIGASTVDSTASRQKEVVAEDNAGRARSSVVVAPMIMHGATPGRSAVLSAALPSPSRWQDPWHQAAIPRPCLQALPNGKVVQPAFRFVGTAR